MGQITNIQSTVVKMSEGVGACRPSDDPFDDPPAMCYYSIITTLIDRFFILTTLSDPLWKNRNIFLKSFMVGMHYET